jgi:hypothetical protein
MSVPFVAPAEDFDVPSVVVIPGSAQAASGYVSLSRHDIDHRRNDGSDSDDEPITEACGGNMGIEVVLVVLAVVVLLIGGTVFSAWRAERAEDREDD